MIEGSRPEGTCTHSSEVPAKRPTKRIQGLLKPDQELIRSPTSPDPTHTERNQYHMSDNNDVLSIDQTTRLLRLYLSWPERVDELGDAEAERFFEWLGEQLDASSLIETTGGLAGVKQFLNTNVDVIAAGRDLKPSGTTENARKEHRIPTSTQVFVVVYDCTEDTSLEGCALRGMMIDMGRNGMRLESKVAIPASSIVSMTVAHSGTPVSLYHLTGEIRWVSQTAETNHMGVLIFNFEDYQKWESDFLSSFSGAF